MSESVVPALPDLDALRRRQAQRRGWSHGAKRDGAPIYLDAAIWDIETLLDYAASLQRERDELRIEVATMRCIHTGSGLPLCRTCDPRTTDEGGPRPVSRNTTTENEHGR